MDDLRAGRELELMAARLAGLMQAGDSEWTSARLLEDEIERRGLQDEYLTALWGVMDAAGDPSPEWVLADIWLFLRATPEQRARAFLEAMKGAGDNA